MIALMRTVGLSRENVLEKRRRASHAQRDFSRKLSQHKATLTCMACEKTCALQTKKHRVMSSKHTIQQKLEAKMAATNVTSHPPPSISVPCASNMILRNLTHFFVRPNRETHARSQEESPSWRLLQSITRITREMLQGFSRFVAYLRFFKEFLRVLY